MSKIGDLFVRLGLKKDDFSRGLDEAGQELQGFEQKTSKMAGVAKAAWLAVAAAVVKFAKDSIQMTQRWGDQFNVAMEGVKGAYGAFVRQLSSGEGWDNLFANMRAAAQAAREMAAELDEIFERKMSANYAVAQAEQEIAKLTLIMNDASKSDAERKKAADDIIEKEKYIGNLKADIARQEADAYKKNILAQTGLEDDQLDYLLKEYNLNRDIINQSRQYLAEQKRLQQEVKATQSGGIMGEESASTTAAIEARHREALANLQALESNTEDGIKAVAALVHNYDKSNDAMIEKFVAADVAAIQFETDAIRATSRANRMLGNLSAKTGSSGGADAAMQNALAIQRAAEQSQKSERTIIEETYQANKALFEQLGLDTTALTAQYFDQVIAAIEKGNEEMHKELVAVADVEMPPLDMSHVDDEINEWLDNFTQTTEKAKALVQDFSQAVAGGFADACQELAMQLFGLEEMNVGAVLKALLTPLADMAIKQGEIIVAQGIAMEAAKKALTNPFTAIAAGAALIAIGAAAKAGLEAVARGGSATTTTATSAAYGGGSTSAAAQEYNTELTIHVEGRLSGSDIVIAGEKTLNSWNR